VRTAIHLDSRSGYAHYNYGVALEAKGEPSEALEEYNRALKFARYDETVWQAIKRVKGKIAANTAPSALLSRAAKSRILPRKDRGGQLLGTLQP
jgi:Tfp pilus assembly protein PilF